MRQFVTKAIPQNRLHGVRKYATLVTSVRAGDSLHGFTVKQVVVSILPLADLGRSRKFLNLNW